MTDLEIRGAPWARFTFAKTPSWNEVFGRGHWRKAQQVTQEWRHLGEQAALLWRKRSGMASVYVPHIKKGGRKEVGHHYEPYVFNSRVLVVVKVVRGTERKFDIHNIFCKALFDGFSDGGLWVDDEWPYIPTVLLTWAHDHSDKGQRFVVEIHEFGSFVINGAAQVLPNGRGGL